MLAEDERLNDPHDVLLVLRVVILQLLQDASFDQPLLVQALLVAEVLRATSSCFLWSKHLRA